MTHTSHPIRPARAAIAAVLALTATPLLAQEAPAIAPVMPMPEAAQPASPAGTPTTASQTPQVQMPTAQPSAPATPPVSATPPAASLPGNPVPMAIPMAPPVVSDVPLTATTPPAEAAERPAPTRRSAPAERPAAREAAPAPVAAAPEANTAADPLAAPPEEAADLAPVAPVAPAFETPAQQDGAVSATESGSGDVWGWMAGLLALLGIGGGAIALRRTRTRKSAVMMAEARQADAEYDRGLAGPHDRPQATTVTTPVPAPSTARLDQPIMQTPAVAPMAAARPASRTAPAARHGNLTVDERRLEDMIAQPPSRDNPFKTRANRKRRALFLLRSYPMQSAA